MLLKDPFTVIKKIFIRQIIFIRMNMLSLKRRMVKFKVYLVFYMFHETNLSSPRLTKSQILSLNNPMCLNFSYSTSSMCDIYLF